LGHFLASIASIKMAGVALREGTSLVRESAAAFRKRGIREGDEERGRATGLGAAKARSGIYPT